MDLRVTRSQHEKLRNVLPQYRRIEHRYYFFSKKKKLFLYCVLGYSLQYFFTHYTLVLKEKAFTTQILLALRNALKYSISIV